MKFFSGLCFSSVAAALTLMTVITRSLLWTKLISLFTILGPSITSTYKGLTPIRPLSCSFEAQLGEHCAGIAEFVGSNPAQSLNFFQVSVLLLIHANFTLVHLAT